MTRKVLIVGAGIAGPALAYWLARHGFRPTVVERHPGPREGGQAVDFRGVPQLTVLDRMGVLPAIRAVQTRPEPIAIVDERGRRLSALPAELFGGEVEILRGDLARILHEATRDVAEYIHDDTITGLDGREVTFERTPPRSFDLVVGADGTHSAVRALAFGPSRPRHLGMYGAIFSVPGHHASQMYSMPGRSATVIGGRAMLDFASPELDHDHRDVNAQKALVANVFADAGWRVPALLEAMWQAPDFYFDAAAQVKLDRWAKGRVALVGDAGYAPGPGGMGTGLAIVGAYVLAGELAAAGGDHETAFARYEQRLRPYAETCQKQAQGGEQFLVPRKRHQIWLRNQAMRMLPYVPGIKGMGTKAANAIALEDYASAAPPRQDCHRC
ncbi:FAD-dependent oxidoreductase [Nonomuraea sp. SBT364]|uniref:FAD-dependent oxidoreductase n=1 Tax=Nonomuraea sp. SBT364 TaxID=1580530 RepID=UPI00066E0B53|nr:FAD-dependent oxidoreductase [Nonomuraea sp. SBT364]